MFVGSESDSEVEDVPIKIVENQKKDKFDKKKTQEGKKIKPGGLKGASKKKSKNKLDTDTDNSLDTDVSVIRDLGKTGKNSPSPPKLVPQRQKQNKKATKCPKKTASLKQQKVDKCKSDSRKFRNSSVESIGDSSIESVNHVDSDSGESDASMQQKTKKMRPKKSLPVSPKVMFHTFSWISYKLRTLSLQSSFMFIFHLRYDPKYGLIIDL